MAEISLLEPLPMRYGAIPIAELVRLYMGHYAGRDTTRVQRLTWWVEQIGTLTLQDVTDDHLHVALEALASHAARTWAGHDAEGKAVFRAKRKAIAPATVNRYAAALSAVFTWAIRRRIAPKGWDHPGRRIERREEADGKTRFLSDGERERLLKACRASKWPRLYLLALLALTTGARKGELLGLRWSEIDLVLRVAMVGRTKNGDPRTLPLIPAVVEQLRRFEGAPGALVFPSKRRPDQAYAIELRWAQALREAKVREFRFHDLRHSCASYLAQHGATLLEIADVLGHRQLQMTKRYSHLATSHKSAMIGRVMGDMQ
jgi:integrase